MKRAVTLFSCFADRLDAGHASGYSSFRSIPCPPLLKRAGKVHPFHELPHRIYPSADFGGGCILSGHSPHLGNPLRDRSNSPPKNRSGTGIRSDPHVWRTARLQSVIATEVVQRALLGGDPSIIVGCSTNNQAVTNINSAMNDVFSDNRSGERFPWARRWVPDADTYGLYLPARRKADEAAAKGFKIAQQGAGFVWTGFPERERDPEKVKSAESMWHIGFSDAYGEGPGTIEAGIDKVRQDIMAIDAECRRIGGRLLCWEAISRWWAESCGSDAESPEHFIDQRRDWLQGEVGACRLTLDDLEENLYDDKRSLDEAVSEKAALYDAAKLKLKDASDHYASAAGAKMRIAAAGAPNGMFEVIGGLVPGVQRLVAIRQHSRRLSALHPHEHHLFHSMIDVYDHQQWVTFAGAIADRARIATEAARSAFNAIAVGLEADRVNRNRVVDAGERDIATARRVLEQAERDSARELADLESKLAALRASEADMRDAYEALRLRSGSTYNDAAISADRPDWLPIIDRVMDVSIRHEMFQKAMRYWEGRWIIEAKRVCQEKAPGTKMSADACLSRFRRWCMLTPCLVLTLHQLPKHMRCRRSLKLQDVARGSEYVSEFLLGAIDLLIMDEAGQVAPHVGMASFALARRALVVGDIYQIEPVVKITRGTDFGNAAHAGLAAFWGEDGPTSPHIISESADGVQGSVMRVVQAATPFTSPNAGKEPGIFLSEHRRCDTDIIQFCNDLVYDGRLLPCTKAGPKPPRMRAWGWAHVRGVSTKTANRSRENQLEAVAIADWLVKRASGEDGWIAHYHGIDPKKYASIKDIVAVTTPFAAQASLIHKALRARGKDFGQITVGTVHSLQGAERPIVIFSPTYSAESGPPESMFFDMKPNMLNVAASRAKDSVVVIGDMRIFGRDGSKRPSSMLARRLFSSPDNEILDVEGNFNFAPAVLKRAERISSLDRHRAVLADAFKTLRRGELLLVVSPYITRSAVQADDIPGLCRTAVGAGGRIHVVVDRDAARNAEKGANEAIAAIREAGGIVHAIPAIHNKTLVVADREIVEGSFNWLSAVRTAGFPHRNNEASYRVSGANAKGDIERAIDEMTKLGVRL